MASGGEENIKSPDEEGSDKEMNSPAEESEKNSPDVKKRRILSSGDESD